MENSAPLIADAPKRERLRHKLERLTPEERREVIDSLPAEVVASVLYDWAEVHARDNQLPPSWEWFVWLILAGRGFGKTRTGAEWLNAEVESGQAPRVALIAATAADARDTMVEGDSGILACSKPWFRPKYEPSKRKLTWPNGHVGLLFSADEPERLRGPQFYRLWGDELCAWHLPRDTEDGKKSNAWDMAMMGLRLGPSPRACVTTTPKPTPILRALLRDPRCAVVKGNTFDNAANLAPQYIATMRRLYEGTRLGRQELYADVLDDVPGALFARDNIEKNRVQTAPALTRIIISVDPAPTSHAGSDETGIIVIGLGYDTHAYVLADESGRYTPDEWSRLIVRLYHKWQADRVVAETNNGGDAVEMCLRTVDSSISYKGILARRGKYKRAEPIGALFEQNKVHMVGTFRKLEDQACIFTGVNGIRDDRVDSMCHGLHELMIPQSDALIIL